MTRKPKRHLPAGWEAYSGKNRKPKRQGRGLWRYGVWATVLLVLAALAFFPWHANGAADGADASSDAVTGHRRQFSLCYTGGENNCVVDGDTVWMDGIKIRLADIDAPETHPPRCPREPDLGRQATLRLQQLANAGFVTAVIDGRDKDRYGRKLRVLMSDGRSIGGILVHEGLARPWGGK